MLKYSGYGRNLAFLSAAGAALLVAMSSSDRAVAQSANDGRQCSQATLHGPYGFTAAGRRSIGQNQTEQFVAVGLRIYDGHGGFSDVASFHGEVLPALRGEVSGTYVVNPDCTGTSILYPPGPIPPIESDFVIVNSGKSVRGVVMSPQPNVVTEILERQQGRPIRVCSLGQTRVFSQLDVIATDLPYMSNERATRVQTTADVQGAGELLVEIVSPGTGKRDEAIKRPANLARFRLVCRVGSPGEPGIGARFVGVPAFATGYGEVSPQLAMNALRAEAEKIGSAGRGAADDALAYDPSQDSQASCR